MRILYCAQFDPCGVGLRQRKHLRELGVDFRLAVERVYRVEGLAADWWLENPGGCDISELADFGADADLVVYCPAINQNWSFDAGGRVREPYDPEDYFPVCIPNRHTVALFHGSLNLLENTDAYAKAYRQAGIPILATTLDYVLRMGAEYVPSIVDVGDGKAPLREGPISVVHASTDPRLTSTEEFLAVTKELDIDVTLVRNAQHEECLAAKRTCNTGFDHLRGSFSINSLENAALGLVNLVGVSEPAREWLKTEWEVTLPWPRVETMADVRRELERLKQSIGLHREMQDMAADWFQRSWNPRITAERILEAYERVADL